MVNRFTPKAQLALSSAKKCAEKMGHSYIGSEHLLLGILGCDSAGKKLLEDKRIFYNDVYAKLTDIAGVGHHSDCSLKELTPKCKKIMEGASACANRFGSSLIGTEHMLYAICEENESVASRILISLGINLQIMKNEVATFLDASTEESRDTRGTIVGAPTLSLYGRNLNYLARMGKFDPTIARDKELERLIQILCRRTKNNPCLIGEPGVGKTAIVEGLAQRISDKNVPQELMDKTVVALDLSSMIAGAKYRGEFEERMKNVMNELKLNNNLILFIDEVHTIIGAGAAEGAVDASNIIKPALARGQMQLIGATTIDEYRRHIEKDSALERRFQPVTVNEPTESEAVQILTGLKEKYEEFHRVKIPISVIEASVKLSQRYITDRFLPDKAIDLIDEACSKAKMKEFLKKDEGSAIKKELDSLRSKKEEAILAEDFQLASKLRDREAELKLRLAKGKREKEKSRQEYPSLTVKDIEDIVTLWTSVPTSHIQGEESARISQLESVLNSSVIGQEDAVKSIACSIKRGRAGLKNPQRPIGSFLFLGPTGVGKTELAKVIAKAVFGGERSLIRLDMSEYMERHSVSRLIGSPPGYVGYEDGGVLTRAVRNRPYSVVLFDEIEKAHPDIYNLLLQILEDGTLTDSQGRQISFKNTILILTSNIGAKSIVAPSTLGFGESKNEMAEHERMKMSINDSLKNEFRPELLNRLDEIIIFKKLSQDDVKKIASVMLNELCSLALDIGISLEFDSTVYGFLSEKGFDKHLGARPLRRAITSFIEVPLSEKILSGEIKNGDTVFIKCENGTVLFESCIPSAK